MTEFFQAITNNLAGVSICGISLATIVGFIVGLVKILSSNKFAKKMAELEIKTQAVIATVKGEIKGQYENLTKMIITALDMLKANKTPNEILAYISTVLAQFGNEEIALEYQKNLATILELKEKEQPTEVIEAKPPEPKIIEETDEPKEQNQETDVKPEIQQTEDTFDLKEEGEVEEEIIVNA